MRLLVLSTPIFKFGPTGTFGYSGLEHLAWQQAEGLARRGHDVSLVCPDDSYCHGVKIIPIGEERKVSEKQAYEKYRHLLPEFDCIIDHTWQKHSYLAKQKSLQPPVIGVCHAPINTMYQTLPPGVERPCFVCISEDQKSHFEALHGRKALVVRNGVCSKFYRPIDTKRTDRFLFLARFSSIKGADIAIEACLAAGIGLDLVGDTQITGEPAFLETCKKLAEKTSPGYNGDKPQIRIIGPVSRGEAVWWYSQAHAFLHPTQRFREPLGLAPVEAMLCGLPVITFNYGAMRETVSSEHGFLVDNMDDFVGAVSVLSRGVTAQHRIAVREWACQFSVESMIDGMEKACEKAVNGGW